MKKTESNLKVIKKAIYFLIKLLFHYFDQGSDILLILDIYNRSKDPKFPEEYQNFYFQGVLTLMVAIFAERFISYKYFIEVHKKEILTKENNDLQQKTKQNKKTNIANKTLDNNNSKTNSPVPGISLQILQKEKGSESYCNDDVDSVEISFRDKLKYFLIVFLYLDYFYYLKHIKMFTSEKYIKSFRKHQLIEYFIESYFFGAFGFSLIHDDLFFFDEFNFIPVFSSFFSIASCCFSTWLYYMERERLIPNMVGKDEINFKQLSNKSKLFILSPFQFQCLKENSSEFSEMTDLIKKNSSLQPKEKQIKKKFVETPSFQKLSSQLRSPIAESPRKPSIVIQKVNKEQEKKEVPKWKKIYLGIYVLIVFNVNFVGIIFSLPTIYGHYAWRTNIIGCILGLPQFILYMIVFSNVNQSTKVKIKEYFKGILLYPLFMYLTYLQMFCAIQTENIPIFSTFKETWTNNLYSSLLKIGLKQVMQTVIFASTYNLQNNKILEEPLYVTPESKDDLLNRVTASEYVYRQAWEVYCIGFYICTMFNIIYLCQWYKYHFFDKGGSDLNNNSNDNSSNSNSSENSSKQNLDQQHLNLKIEQKKNIISNQSFGKVKENIIGSDIEISGIVSCKSTNRGLLKKGIEDENLESSQESKKNQKFFNFDEQSDNNILQLQNIRYFMSNTASQSVDFKSPRKLYYEN